MSFFWLLLWILKAQVYIRVDSNKLMKSIIIYYSLSGNTDIIAHALADTMQSELVRIKPVNELKEGKFSQFLDRLSKKSLPGWLKN